MGNKNKHLKKRYRDEFINSLGMSYYPIGIDLGSRANHFLSRVYYHDHHKTFRAKDPEIIQKLLKTKYSRNLFYK